MPRQPGIHAIVLLLLSATAALAHGVKTKTLDIIHPWTKPVQEAGADTIVRMTIANRSRRDDRLLSASSAAAEAVDICARAREPSGACAATAVPIRNGLRTELSAEGSHLVLKGLKRPLAAYDMIALSLIFERAGRIDVEVMVED